MPYILTVEALESREHYFDSVAQAITFYSELQLGEETANRFGAKLRNPTQGTHLDVYPGVTVQSATQELESVWEWAPEDQLKIRPFLKERYRIKA